MLYVRAEQKCIANRTWHFTLTPAPGLLCAAKLNTGPRTFKKDFTVPLTVWILTLAQALAMTVAPLMVFSGGIVGSTLAPKPSLATLPVACIVIGTALAVMPMTRLMQRFGRKKVFLLGGAISIVASLAASWGVHQQSFAFFCGASLLLGVGIAVAQQYRFAAIEAVDVNRAGQAASQVLLGGLVAAYLGPELVVYGPAVADALGLPADNAPHRVFVGAFLLLGLICVGTVVVIGVGYRNQQTTMSEERVAGRPLAELFRNPLLWLAVGASAMGYAMMSFMMTATPLDMHAVQGHSLVDTKWVIQSHIIAMFLPSLFSGWLIARLGHRGLISLGVTAYVICLLIALSGQHLHHYWWALILLGIGWNFLFVGGTALLPLCYRPEERFRVQSVNEFAVFGCQAVAALSSGWVINQFGWQVLLWVSASMVVAVLALLWANRAAPVALSP